MRVAEDLDFQEDLYLTVRELVDRGFTKREISGLVGSAVRGSVPNKLKERLDSHDRSENFAFGDPPGLAV